jgi:hypothetical protein
MLAEQKKQEMLAQQQQQTDMMNTTGAKPKFGAERSSPMAQASPLKTEITSNFNK